MEEKILQMLVEKEEISWKGMLYELVKGEGMDPWDVNVSLLTEKYIEKLKQLKEVNLKISGKVLLAAAILLRIKSKRLMEEDLNEFDRLLASAENTEEQFYDSLEEELKKGEQLGTNEQFELYPHMPQPRKRKVSIFDLVEALNKALEVKKRRFDRFTPIQMKIPEIKFDITVAIKNIYDKITSLIMSAKEITFSQLLPSQKKEDKVYTFIPLLHLANQNKIDLEQEKHFDEIKIKITQN